MSLADSLLKDLFGKMEKGESIVKETPKKKKRQLYINEEERYTYRLHEPTLKSIALVLERHDFKCACGATHSSPNMHILCIKEDKHGNRHETRFITQSDIDELPRITRPMTFKVTACHECFSGSEALRPVCDEEAKKDIAEVEIDAAVNQLLHKWEEESK
jgi:hypothetical protein